MCCFSLWFVFIIDHFCSPRTNHNLSWTINGSFVPLWVIKIQLEQKDTRFVLMKYFVLQNNNIIYLISTLESLSPWPQHLPFRGTNIDSTLQGSNFIGRFLCLWQALYLGRHSSWFYFCISIKIHRKLCWVMYVYKHKKQCVGSNFFSSWSFFFPTGSFLGVIGPGHPVGFMPRTGLEFTVFQFLMPYPLRHTGSV